MIALAGTTRNDKSTPQVGPARNLQGQTSFPGLAAAESQNGYIGFRV